MAELRAFLLTPLENPSLLRSLGIRAATGALLHGPPGCGKTSVARALAQESRGVANFLEVRCSDLVDKVRIFSAGEPAINPPSAPLTSAADVMLLSLMCEAEGRGGGRRKNGTGCDEMRRDGTE